MNERRFQISMEDLEADFRAQGMSNSEVVRQLARTDKEMLRDTLHEASHCLVAWLLGFPVHEMNIDEFEAIKRGYKIVKFEIAGFKLKYLPEKTNFKLAVVALAGLAAEGMMFRESYKRSAWKPDIDEAKDYLKQLPNEEDQAVAFNRALNAAKKIVRENWRRIERLTIGAYHFGPILDGARVLDLMTGADEMEDESVSPPVSPR